MPGLPDIDGYRLLSVLGHGGMSTVYLAEQLSLGRQVAIKVMLPEALADEVSRRRFENEARTVARLDHPHIVGIHEVGRTRDGLPWYAMPHLPRGHLAQVRFFEGEDDAADEARVVGILRSLLEALDYAHAHGVVHRDVKAENVLFDDAGRALLADFGIALRKEHGPRVTTAGLAVGSTAYMAPEQARGEEVEGSADLYSVGVLAWEMLTGELPYVSSDALSTAMMHVQDPIPRLPPRFRHWQRFIDKAMAKTPATRYQSPAEMLSALNDIARRRQSPLWAWWSDLRERAAAPAVAWAGVAVVALVVAAVVWWPSTPLEPALQTASAATGDGTRAPPRIQPTVTTGPSAADPFVEAAALQIQARKLTQPEGDNAHASVLAAWEADPRHPALAETTDALVAALGTEVARHLRGGDVDRARDYYARAQDVARAGDREDSAAMAGLREAARDALSDGVRRAAAQFDQLAATRLAALALVFGADAASADALDAAARAVPVPGDVVPGDPADAVLVRGNDGLFAAMPAEVTRADYTRFATATKRPDALCRERLSPLRLVAPKSWHAPGFEQTAGDPVVCISWSDADAYARWFAARTGKPFRLPTLAERQALSGVAREQGRAVAEWLQACGANCQERLVAGTSWRGAAGSEAREAARGFDDVGFRLVRDL